MRFLKRLKFQRVIIYGFHSEDWNLALGPNSKVWKLLPNVDKVLAVEGLPEFLPKRKLFFNDCTIPLMENHIKTIPDSSTTLKPRLEILEKFANKKHFHLLLKDLNLDQYQPNVYSDQNITKFPIVLKRTNLNACQGIKIIFTRQELNDSLSQDMWRGKEIIIQEFIENTNEFVWHAVYKDGVRLWDTTIKYVKSNSLILRDPNSEIDSIIFETNPDATKVFDQIMCNTNYSGPCNIDFSYKSSNLKIFEINPRIGGSLMKPENRELLAQALKTIIKAA